MDRDLLHDLADRLTDRLDTLDATVRERLPRDLQRFTAPPPEPSSGPSRLLWAAIGCAAGMGVAYLADPDRGQGRRNELQQRLTSTTTDVAERARKRVGQARDQAKGAVAERARKVTPQDVPDDPKTLESRIRSQVFGRRADVDKVVLRVDAPGTVAVKGTVPSPTTERELLAEISDVDGVIDVTSELQVSGG